MWPKLSLQSALAITARLKWARDARPEQLAPDAYKNLFACAGRGWGKTRFAAEEVWWKGWINDAWRIGVIAPTFGDVRTVCFEGESGLLGCVPPEIIESYNKSEVVLKLKNGTIISGYSTDDPNRFRGPQHHALWCEEIASWNNPQEVWDMSAFGLRLGTNPQRIITSTPKPIQLIRDIIDDPKTTVIRGSTYANKANLPDSFFDELKKYEGTSLGRQELYGEVLDMEEMGIFKRSWLKIWPHDKPLPKFDLVVQSWDTAFSEKSSADYTAFAAFGLWRPIEGSKMYHAIMIDCWQEQIAYPDMRVKAMKEYQTKYGEGDKSVDMVIIEKKASGQSLIQDLRRSGVNVKEFEPGQSDKVQRAHLVSHLVHDGYLWMPESRRRDRKGQPCDWANELVEQMVYFPNSKNDDYVDTVVQFLTVMAKMDYVKSVGLPEKQSYWRRTMRPPQGGGGVYG